MITGILKTIMYCSGLPQDIYMLLNVFSKFITLCFEDQLETCLDMKIPLLDDQIKYFYYQPIGLIFSFSIHFFRYSKYLLSYLLLYCFSVFYIFIYIFIYLFI